MRATPKELTHSLPLNSTFGFPIYVTRVPAAPFASRLAPISMQLDSFTPVLPSSLMRSLPLTHRYLAGYPVHLANSQSARFSLDRECAVRKACHRRNDGRKKSSSAVDGVHLTFRTNAG